MMIIDVDDDNNCYSYDNYDNYDDDVSIIQCTLTQYMTTISFLYIDIYPFIGIFLTIQML